jgi:CRP/FNR family cyclic AMP-dependent transcriptional regulator
MSLMERFGRTAPAGTVLFRESDPGTEMFVLQSGRVRLTRMLRGQEKLVAELSAGEFFGEMSIINDKPRTATAVVVDDAQLLVLDPRTFEAMIKANTEIAVRMVKKLAARLDVANAQIENLLLGDPNSRIVHALLQRTYGARRDADGSVVVATNAGVLAERTNVDPSKVDEVLARLERSQLIVRDPDGLRIPDQKKLHEFLAFLEMRERFGEAG